MNKFVNSVDNLEVYRFCCVLFGVVFLFFLLNVIIWYYFSENDNWIMKDLIENMYMDNVVIGINCDDNVLEYYFLLWNYL